MDQPVVFVDRDAGSHPAPPPSSVPGSDMEAQLMEAIEAIRPALQADGGDVNVVGINQETGVVDLELVGKEVGAVEVTGNDEDVALDLLLARGSEPIAPSAFDEFDELEVLFGKMATKCLALVVRVDGDRADSAFTGRGGGGG